MASYPVALPGLAALALGLFAFLIALIAARRGRVAGETGARRSSASIAGIALQACAFVIVASGPIKVTRDPLSALALAQAALVAIVLGAAVALFVWATRTMGRNWSLVARTRADHTLVTSGPFAFVRHPIYVALVLLLLALALATGHLLRLLSAFPLYALGTALRVRAEEKLLHAQFGDRFVEYTLAVRRFIPRVI